MNETFSIVHFPPKIKSPFQYVDVRVETGFAAARFLVGKGWSIGITGGIPDEPEPE